MPNELHVSRDNRVLLGYCSGVTYKQRRIILIRGGFVQKKKTLFPVWCDLSLGKSLQGKAIF